MSPELNHAAKEPLRSRAGDMAPLTMQEPPPTIADEGVKVWSVSSPGPRRVMLAVPDTIAVLAAGGAGRMM